MTSTVVELPPDVISSDFTSIYPSVTATSTNDPETVTANNELEPSSSQERGYNSASDPLSIRTLPLIGDFNFLKGMDG